MEQGGALLCTTHMPSDPHANLPCIAEKRHLPNQTHKLPRRNHNTGGKHVAGRHNPREKGRSASARDGAGMCTTPMPHLLTQPSHALPKNAICPTKLTSCDEGRMTRCGNTWRGDMTHKRNGRSASAQDGAGLCTTPMPHFLTQPLLALPKHAICPTKLTCCDEGSMTQEGNTWRGDITQERKEGQQVHKMGQVCAPHPCHNPSHNPRMHCRKTPFAQPNSLAATKEP